MEYKKIKDITDINPENITNDMKFEYINYLDTSNITKGKINDIIKIDYKDAPSRAKRIVKVNDIIYSSVRPNLCHYGILRNVFDNMIVSTGFIVLRCKENVLPEYLYAYITLPEITKKMHLIAITSTSAYPSIKPDDLANLEIPLPSLKKQEQISKILSTIDKKIELNNQVNQNLQKLSQELYKKWFVDFEFPNEEGKPYKSSGGKMVNSEFRLIPEGWNYRKISDVVDFINGYGFNSNMLLDNYEKDTYKVFKMGNIKIGGGVNKEKTKSWIYKKDCSNLEKFILKKGDILMCMTDMKNSATPLLGHTALMDTDNEYIVNQRVGLLRCKKKFINYPYIYILSNLDFFIDELRSRANSGVQVNLSTKEICDTKILIPNKRIHDEFNKIVEPMYEKVFKIQRENEILKNLLNILLPELMNGEIDLDNIEI